MNDLESIKSQIEKAFGGAEFLASGWDNRLKSIDR